jgi:hypothetical protein
MDISTAPMATGASELPPRKLATDRENEEEGADQFDDELSTCPVDDAGLRGGIRRGEDIHDHETCRPAGSCR